MMFRSEYHTKSLKAGMLRATTLSLLLVVLILPLIVMQIAIAQEILVQTGFEDVTLGELPQDWDVVGTEFQVTDDTVKNGNKSDDLLIYEGGEPPLSTPVNLKGKLATFWGQVKKDVSCLHPCQSNGVLTPRR